MRPLIPDAHGVAAAIVRVAYPRGECHRRRCRDEPDRDRVAVSVRNRRRSGVVAIDDLVVDSGARVGERNRESLDPAHAVPAGVRSEFHARGEVRRVGGAAHHRRNVVAPGQRIVAASRKTLSTARLHRDGDSIRTSTAGQLSTTAQSTTTGEAQMATRSRATSTAPGHGRSLTRLDGRQAAQSGDPGLRFKSDR
jgi:hypothetical protein